MLQTGSGSGLSVLVLQMAAIGLVFYFTYGIRHSRLQSHPAEAGR